MAVISIATTTLVARVTNVETVTCMIGVDPGSQTRVWELETSPSLEYYAYDHSEVSSFQKKRFEQAVRVGCAALVLKAIAAGAGSVRLEGADPDNLLKPLKLRYRGKWNVEVAAEACSKLLHKAQKTFGEKFWERL